MPWAALDPAGRPILDSTGAVLTWTAPCLAEHWGEPVRLQAYREYGTAAGRPVERRT
jgi:hypothetical protein